MPTSKEIQDEIDNINSKSDNNQAIEDIDWEEAFREEKEKSKKTEVSTVQFGELKSIDTKPAGLNIDFLMEIPLNLSVELGRTKILIRELLQLGQGSIIELTKLAGEPMDIFVNNRLIARGEVVVVNEKFGIRLTDVISPEERINYLK